MAKRTTQKTRPMATVPVKLPEEMRDALRQRSREEDRPVSVIIRRALREYLEAQAS